MAGFEGQNLGGYPESEPAVLQIMHAELRAEAARAVEQFAGAEIGRQVSSDQQLQAAITELQGSGEQSDPVFRSNMRQVVAERIGYLLYHGRQARTRHEYFRLVAAEIGQELQAMADLEAGVSDVPDLWDLAYEELLASEGSTEE